MSDINYDELDAAVTSALKSNTAGSAPASDAAAVDTSQATANPAPEATTAPATVIKSQRRGQFMDVVHPSSDMRRTNSSRELSSARKRSGQITPLSRDVVETDTEAEAGSSEDLTVPTVPLTSAGDMPTPESESQGEQQDTTSAETVPEAAPVPEEEATSAQPDDSSQNEETNPEVPVDMPPAQENPAEDTAATPETSEPIEALSLEEPKEESDEPVGEPTNPFIEGASIEKRPLGAFAGDTSTEESQPVEAKPEENSDRSFGSYDPIDYGPASTEAAAVESEPAPGLESPENEPVQPAADNDMAATGGVGALSQSIPQQYRPEVMADDDDEPASNVFSAEQYEAPLPPPKPKSRIALVIILLLLMIILGAGAAYAIFVLKLL